MSSNRFRRLSTLSTLVIATLVAAGALAATASASTAASTADPSTSATSTAPAAPAAPAASAGVKLWTESIPPLATIGGVPIDGAGFGSSFVARPGSSTHFYGLTDRGPNVDGPDGTKVEPLPDFAPSIGEFVLPQGAAGQSGKARLVRTITLKAADGTPYDGRTSLSGSTGETILDLDGNVLPASPYGYDPEGLAAMPDGTFWVSDEYGPFVTHFSATGRQLERLTPYDGSLPVELSEREPNRGMEGLTVTPDGKYLVGIMQSGLNAPDGPKAKKTPVVRIVTIDLASRAVNEYVYLLHTTADGVDTAVSEIAAIDNRTFLVLERDGALEPGANKKLYRVTLPATDVSKHSHVPGSTYDALHGGLLVGGHTVEGIAGEVSTAQARSALLAVGIRPVTASRYLDIAGLVSAIGPTGAFFGHDKVEGVAVLDGGRRLVISNDSDFGIDGVTGDTPPFTLTPKLLPDGTQDTGELLDVTLASVPDSLKS